MKTIQQLNEAFISNNYSGIIGITALLGWVLLTEIGSSIIGGDLGSFLYVTFHFVANPIICLVVIIMAIWHGIKSETIIIKTLDFIVCVIPAAVIHSGITGSFWLSDLLRVSF